jgi:hypothetical protein
MGPDFGNLYGGTLGHHSMGGSLRKKRKCTAIEDPNSSPAGTQTTGLKPAWGQVYHHRDLRQTGAQRCKNGPPRSLAQIYVYIVIYIFFLNSHTLDGPRSPAMPQRRQPHSKQRSPELRCHTCAFTPATCNGEQSPPTKSGGRCQPNRSWGGGASTLHPRRGGQEALPNRKLGGIHRDVRLSCHQTCTDWRHDAVQRPFCGMRGAGASTLTPLTLFKTPCPSMRHKRGLSFKSRGVQGHDVAWPPSPVASVT